MATVEESIERAGAQLTQIVTAAKVPNISLILRTASEQEQTFARSILLS